MYRGKSIYSLKELFESGELTKEEAFLKANNLAHYFQNDYNSFVTILDKVKIKDSDKVKVEEINLPAEYQINIKIKKDKI